MHAFDCVRGVHNCRGMSELVDTIGARLDLDDLRRDPYPAFARMRRDEPVCWVPSLSRYLVTRYRDVVTLERRPEVFSANEQGSLMTQVMGHTLLRKDGEAHARQRRAVQPAMKPGPVAARWQAAFERNAHDVLRGLAGRSEADLFTDVAGPYAARNLRDMLGLRDVADTDLQRWSQALIDGGGSNYGGDPRVRTAAMAATAEVDEAVDAAVEHVRSHPDGTVISHMVHAPENLLPEEIRADVKVFVAGGLNEPRDALLTAAWAVLRDPTVRAATARDPAVWREVFEEALRWISPIGMYPRQVTQPVELGGVALHAGDRVGVCLGSANRDEDVFERPDEFLLGRPKTPHVAFGGGPHYCLGTWAARMQVAQVGLPALFAALPGLTLHPRQPVQVGGWVFRGPLTVPVTWSA